MSNVTVGDLLHIYHQLHYEIDDGKTAPIDDAQDAIVDGEVVDYIEKHANVDLSLFSQGDLDAIDDTFASWGVYDKKRTGAYNNGLAMISSNLILISDNAPTVDPNSGSAVKVSDLEIH